MNNKMFKIAFVGCSKNKRNEPCMASEMYDKSALFVLCKQYIIQNKYDMWFILSAKYGLLYPETIIEPYDKSLYKMSRFELKKWENTVIEQIRNILSTINENIVVDFYCGNIYRKEFVKYLRQFGVVVNEPLKGKSIGHQLKYLKGLN